MDTNVAHIKHVDLCHIFISYSLDSVSITMHMVKCTKPILFVLKSFWCYVLMQAGT